MKERIYKALLALSKKRLRRKIRLKRKAYRQQVIIQRSMRRLEYELEEIDRKRLIIEAENNLK